jgi:hypothetical protein
MDNFIQALGALFQAAKIMQAARFSAHAAFRRP